MRSLTIAAIAGLALAFVPPPDPARAGQYELHSCRLPDGTHSPLVDWSPTGGNDARFSRSDACLGNGYFDVEMLASGTQSPAAGRHWRLALPPGVRLRRMRGRLAAMTRPGGHVVDAIADNGLGNLSLGFGAGRGTMRAWNDAANAFDTGPFTATGTYLLGTRCVAGAPCGPLSGMAKAYVRVFRTQATLEDLSIPRVEKLAGRLLEPGVHRGVEGFALDASDSGAGVYRLVVELDGVERLAEVLDPSAGQCADQVPGNGSDYDFTTATPCLPRVSGSRTLDTRLLPDGEHTLRLLVEDAAGNRRVAAGPVDGWRVENRLGAGDTLPPPSAGPPAGPAPRGEPISPNGTPAVERARLELYFRVRRTRRRCRAELGPRGELGRRCARVPGRSSVRRGAVLRSPYGRRARLTGRLMTLDGRPIRGARLHLRRTRRGTRHALERFDVRTGPAGRFRTVLGRAPSERIRAVYYATSATRRPVRSRVLVRRVGAGIAIRAGRRAGVVRGRLHGGSRPRAGVRVAGEVRIGRRWVGFAHRRVRARASFVLALRAPGGHSRRVRLRVLRTAGYPYEPSVSRAVVLRARR